MPSKEEFKGFGEIDLDNLEVEAARQTKRIEKWAMMQEEAKADLVEAEAELDLVEADLRLRIVKRPQKFDVPDKPAEKIVTAAIILDENYQKARKRRDGLKRRVAYCGVALLALDHRKKMIEKLADLFQSKYWSLPRLSSKELDDRGDREVAAKSKRHRR